MTYNVFSGTLNPTQSIYNRKTNSIILSATEYLKTASMLMGSIHKQYLVLQTFPSTCILKKKNFAVIVIN